MCYNDNQSKKILAKCCKDLEHVPIHRVNLISVFCVENLGCPLYSCGFMSAFNYFKFLLTPALLKSKHNISLYKFFHVRCNLCSHFTMTYKELFLLMLQ